MKRNSYLFSIFLLVLTTEIAKSEFSYFTINDFVEYINSQGLDTIIQNIAKEIDKSTANYICESLAEDHKEFCPEYTTTYMEEISSPVMNAETYEDNEIVIEPDTEINEENQKNEEKEKSKIKKILFPPDNNSLWAEKLSEREREILVHKIMKKRKLK